MTDINTIRSLEVPVIVQLGERMMTVREVMALVPGSIIELPKPADEELDLMVNNKRIGSGTAVKIGENFGIKVSYIGDRRDRVAAVDTEAPPPQSQPTDDADPTAQAAAQPDANADREPPTRKAG